MGRALKPVDSSVESNEHYSKESTGKKHFKAQVNAESGKSGML